MEEEKRRAAPRLPNNNQRFIFQVGEIPHPNPLVKQTLEFISLRERKKKSTTKTYFKEQPLFLRETRHVSKQQTTLTAHTFEVQHVPVRTNPAQHPNAPTQAGQAPGESQPQSAVLGYLFFLQATVPVRGRETWLQSGVVTCAVFLSLQAAVPSCSSHMGAARSPYGTVC